MPQFRSEEIQGPCRVFSFHVKMPYERWNAISEAEKFTDRGEKKFEEFYSEVLANDRRLGTSCKDINSFDLVVGSAEKPLSLFSPSQLLQMNWGRTYLEAGSVSFHNRYRQFGNRLQHSVNLTYSIIKLSKPTTVGSQEWVNTNLIPKNAISSVVLVLVLIFTAIYLEKVADEYGE